MRKFICEQFVFNVSLPEEHSETFTAFFNRYQTSQLSTDKVPVGSSALFHMSTHGQLGACIDWSNITYISLPSAYKLMQLDSDDRQLLAETYQCMNPDKHILPGMVGEVCRKYSSVLLAGEKIVFRSECRSIRSARIMASWADQDGQVSSRTALNFRPGIVLFFFANTIKFRGAVPDACVCVCKMVQRGLVERTLSASCGNLETEKLISAQLVLQLSCQFKYATASLLLRRWRLMELKSRLCVQSSDLSLGFCSLKPQPKTEGRDPDKETSTNAGNRTFVVHTQDVVTSPQHTCVHALKGMNLRTITHSTAQANGKGEIKYGKRKIGIQELEKLDSVLIDFSIKPKTDIVQQRFDPKVIDECMTQTHKCDPNSYCSNTIGSYGCTFKEGFKMSEKKICKDIEECMEPNICGPHTMCTNHPATYKCSCLQGFESKNKKKLHCTDIDECITRRSNCNPNSYCSNTIGSFGCTCKEGFKMSDEGSCEGETTNCSTYSGTRQRPFDLWLILRAWPHTPPAFLETSSQAGHVCQLASEDRTRVLRRRLSEQNIEATDTEPAYGDDFRIEPGHHWMKTCRSSKFWQRATGDSNCGGTEYVNGFYRDANQGERDMTDLLRNVSCCTAPPPDENSGQDCTLRRFWDELNHDNTWAKCPPGMFIQGIKRTTVHGLSYLSNIEGLICCSPKDVTPSYEDCHEKNVSFNDQGWMKTECVLVRAILLAPELKDLISAGAIEVSKVQRIMGRIVPDINECEKRDTCGGEANCENTFGSYKCNCSSKGFEYNAKRRRCFDIDECREPSICGPNANCTNQPSTYVCSCMQGYESKDNNTLNCTVYNYMTEPKKEHLLPQKSEMQARTERYGVEAAEKAIF
ncbi:Latent-transforming growth factor beta-binding protein 1 [Acropora cervicornis]|uniref:Latent-transforming growth factor beta-binding protein 1 n=1 Tax=Acropora cervicornis TaxID=6130 RepID=A0AAD9Q7X0_ACRCE|nr:Latent-transforming growth factor beta-binding protein 1 [Acropora cervicornis]